MKQLINEISNSSNNIYMGICEIATILNQTDWIDILAPWILSIISGIVGYRISSGNEKKKFKRSCLIDYLTFTNYFLIEVNAIIMKLVNLQKLAKTLIDFDKKTNAKYSYFYENLSNYSEVVLKISKLRNEIESLEFNEPTYSAKNQYKEEYIKQSDDVLNFNKFVEICENYQRKALNYYYLISRDLRKEHADIIETITKATQNNLVNFNIENLKKDLINHINHINEKIIGQKIKEPNFFDAVNSNTSNNA